MFTDLPRHYTVSQAVPVDPADLAALERRPDKAMVWDQTARVVQAALVFAGTWRECYPSCSCLRCDLAAEADRLAEMLKRPGEPSLRS